MKKAVLRLETLTCPSCLQKINNAVKGLEGVNKESVEVLFNSSRVKLDFDNNLLTIKDVENAIEKLGYEVLNSKVS